MSLKRYAIIAAVSYHNSQQQQQQQASTTMQTIRQQQQQLIKTTPTIATKETAIKSTTLTTTIDAPQSTTLKATNATQESNGSTNWIALNVSTYTATTATAANTNAGNGSTGVASSTTNSGSNSNSITTYYGGGLGLFHQQNLRANGAIGGSYLHGNGNNGNNGGGSGVSYPNTINGNVNLLLGGAMLSLVTTILCVVCYCCHRNIKKRTEAAYRQQRQWLENDPNMEIYSVEQCYETSGLFLGESTDGLSTIPALHHEPPPSYDAVVAMQEQLLLQQQQQSPPPGYRSSLDVSAITTAFAAAVAATGSRGTLDGTTTATTTTDSNGNLSNVASGRSTIYQQKPNQMLSLNPLLNMKKVLQAQSCCSLQRAEVENMWNAAAAAVAARNATTHVQSSCASTAENATPTPAMLMTARKSLPTYAFGRHYRHQKSYYRRGCPLCGKFRYDADDALSLSTESELDNSTTETATTSTSYAASRRAVQRTTFNDNASYNEIEEQAAVLQGANYQDYSNNNGEETILMTVGEPSNNNVTTTRPQYDETDGCLCDSTAATPRDWLTRQQFRFTETLHTPEYDEPNGNDVNRETLQKMQFTVEANEVQDNQNSNEALAAASNEMDDNANNNTRLTTATEQIASPSNSNVLITEGIESTTPTTSGEAIDLNSITENGIVRLDMSKIIDKTGLPTYEAALKLESSGYV